MSTVFETGHSKNVANLLKYEQFLATLGVAYNPSNVNITVSAFTNLYIIADAKVNSANTTFTDWKNNTNQRELIFKELKSLSTKLLGALQEIVKTLFSIILFILFFRKTPTMLIFSQN